MNLLKGKHEVRFSASEPRRYSESALIDVSIRPKFHERLESHRYHSTGALPSDEEVEAIARSTAAIYLKDEAAIAEATERLLAPLRA